jgi:hypothetical protein
MSDSPKKKLIGDDVAVWRSYFQAAITGLLAAGNLDPRSSGVVGIIVDVAARVADAGVEEDRLRT